MELGNYRLENWFKKAGRACRFRVKKLIRGFWIRFIKELSINGVKNCLF